MVVSTNIQFIENQERLEINPGFAAMMFTCVKQNTTKKKTIIAINGNMHVNTLVIEIDYFSLPLCFLN